MECIREFMLDGAEQDFREALRMNDEDSKSDSETKPYKSMYVAREIWHRLKTQVERSQNERPDVADWTILTATLNLRLGSNYIDTEETSTGEELLKKCIESLTSERLNVRACNIIQSALNQMGILCANRHEPKKGLDYLQESESLYKQFRDEVGGAPWTVTDVFCAESYADSEDGRDKSFQKRCENFEDTFTHTLYYLAQVYGKLDECRKSAEYCHETLRRQLDNHKYQPIEWSLNAALLAQYYFSVNNFVMSRHCLASAELILKEAGQPDRHDIETDEATASSKEKIQKAWADLYRCWVKYGLSLLEYSKERLFKELDNDHNSNSPIDNRDSENSKEDNRRLFFDIELTSIEDQITDEPVCVFAEARAAFLKIQTWLNAAKTFYRLDGQCSDHVELIRDHSSLYKVLVFFEPDLDRQCKMQKRRADMLLAILKKLNPQFYLLVCRQLMFELAETYSAILDNKLALIEESDTPPNEHARKKINVLAAQSIEQFMAYINTLKKPDGVLPVTLQDDDERPALIAHFYIGRLYSKIINLETASRLVQIQRSLENYKFIVDYCKRNPGAVKKVKHEREICEEMVALLPAKMTKIQSESL